MSGTVYWLADRGTLLNLPPLGRKVGVFLVGLPGLAGLGEQGDQVLRGVLVGGAVGGEGIVVVGHAEVGARFSPDVVGLGGMDVRVVAVRGGEDVVIGVGVGDLFADVLRAAVDLDPGGAVDEAIDEGSVGVLVDLLDAAGELVRGLRPVVVFHRDDEDGFDFLGIALRLHAAKSAHVPRRREGVDRCIFVVSKQ